MSKSVWAVTWKQLDGKQWKVRSTWVVAESSREAIANIKRDALGDKYVKSYKCSNFTARLATADEIAKAKSGKYYLR